jgi:hypothetical protein
MAAAASCEWNRVSSNETGARHASDSSPYTFVQLINYIGVYKIPSVSRHLHDVCVFVFVCVWERERPVVVRPLLSSKVRPHFKIHKSHRKNKYLVIGPEGTRNQDWLCWIELHRLLLVLSTTVPSPADSWPYFTVPRQLFVVLGRVG